MTIGEYIKFMREKADVSQTELAAKAGYVSAQYVSNIERNVCPPGLRFLKVAFKLIELDAKKTRKLICDFYMMGFDEQFKELLK